MKQCTGPEFLEQIKTAPEWQLVQGPGSGQLLLAVRNVPDADPVYFLGPHPWDTDPGEYEMFSAAVEDAVMMQATHDDQSTTDKEEKDAPQ